jgi:putative FmdB family regulatory protein
MPIFDYNCRACGKTFEALIRRDATPACPSCQATDVEKLLSLPAVKSDATRSLAMRAAKKRDRTQATDRMHERLRYEESHDRHG